MCVVQHAIAFFFITADNLNVSFGTILRGDSTLNQIFVYLYIKLLQEIWQIGMLDCEIIQSGCLWRLDTSDD